MSDDRRERRRADRSRACWWAAPLGLAGIAAVGVAGLPEPAAAALALAGALVAAGWGLAAWRARRAGAGHRSVPTGSRRRCTVPDHDARRLRRREEETRRALSALDAAVAELAAQVDAAVPPPPRAAPAGPPPPPARSQVAEAVAAEVARLQRLLAAESEPGYPWEQDVLGMRPHAR